MKSLTQKALWPHDEKCWSSLFRFCNLHGQTLRRKVVKVHASSDFQGGLVNELTETHTTENCGYGFLFGDDKCLRQADVYEGDKRSSGWEVVQGYLGQEKVVIQIRSWSDLVGTGIDAALAAALKTAKAEYRARIDALLASLPEPEETKPEPKSKVDYINDDVVDWNDYDDDDYWG